MSGAVVLWIAVALAGMAGFCGWRAWNERARAARVRQQVTRMRGSPEGATRQEGDALIGSLERLSGLLEHGQTRALCPPKLGRSVWYVERAQRSGLAVSVSEQAFCELRFRMTVGLAAVGCVVGCLFSTELAVLLGLVGAVIGWRMPASSVKRCQDQRTRAMEAHLPEMLDVMALGMGSGLSFDSALKLYCAHFKTGVAQDLRRAQSAWESGLERREEALRRIARSYDSTALTRVTESWIRSLRFGTSMVEGLAAEGAQARAAYKAKREERIAKAPVKMMVPTGTLILPAMLVLVLGPVLLELMSGGV